MRYHHRFRVRAAQADWESVARLVVGEYQVLVLDEPSEHLDPETADALLDDVWASASGLPLLVITHDPAVVARCDRVVHLG